jgi:hypothetical protein
MDIMVLQIAVIGCATVAISAGLRFAARYLEMRQRSRASLGDPADFEGRLKRIELIVETTAVEVERISEANRFLAKLLANKGTPSPERANTPH